MLYVFSDGEHGSWGVPQAHLHAYLSITESAALRCHLCPEVLPLDFGHGDPLEFLAGHGDPKRKKTYQKTNVF